MRELNRAKPRRWHGLECNPATGFWDWAAWKEVEGLVAPIQNSIPLEAGRGTRRELQEQQLDMLTLLCRWDLHDRQAGRWQLPQSHSAWPEEDA